jgi:hypothetical protein
MNHTAPRGYIGIIGLLIAAAIIGFIFWRSDIFSAQPPPAAESGADLLHGRNQIEQGRGAVDAAENAKRSIENNYATQQKDAQY